MHASTLLRRPSWLLTGRNVQLVATALLAATFALGAPQLESWTSASRGALAMSASTPADSATGSGERAVIGAVPQEAQAFRGEARAVPAGPAFESGVAIEALAEPAR